MRRSPPRFTVLLPTHNRADVVGLAIRSVLAQSVTDFELLVVGDGCTDTTAEVVHAFADPRLAWLDLPKAPHHGGANRNVALARARGELMAYQAHDDLWLPDHLERLAACFGDERIVLAYSRPLWVTPAGQVIPLAFNLGDPGTRAEFLARRRNAIPAACVVYRRRCHSRVAGWDETLPDNGDWDLWARILETFGAQALAVVTAPTCLHFRASWRTELNEGPPELAAWKGERAAAELAAPALAVDLAAHPTEQAAYLAAIEGHGELWVAGLRSAVEGALDRRLAESDSLIASSIRAGRRHEAEIWELRGRLRELGHDVPVVTDELSFGPGFHDDEGGWRWMKAEGHLDIVRPRVPATLLLDIASGPSEAYPFLPFALHVESNGVVVASATFATGGERVQLRVPLQRPSSHLVLHSGATFVPRRTGHGGDVRELAVCLVAVRVEEGT